MKAKHLLYCFLLTAGHYVYTLSFPSIINGERFLGTGAKILEPSYIHAFFLSRLKFGEFARRPVTTFLIQSLEKFGFPLEYAFLAVLYVGFFLALVLLFRLSLKLTGSATAAFLSSVLFTGSFWVIHAFFAEIYAYDEPWQYAFVFGALEFLRQQKWMGFSFLFLLALITRESTILLLPGIFFFFMLESPLWSRANLVRILKVGWTLPAYGFITWLVIRGKELGEKSSSYMRDVRFKHLYYSFEQLDMGVVTLTSFVMAVALPFALWHAYRRVQQSRQDRPWVNAFIMNFGINAFVTFVFTMGRETRIFAQPVLMLSPFLGLYFLQLARQFKMPFAYAFYTPGAFARWLGYVVFFACICFAFSLFAYEVYWPTDTKFFSGFQHHVYLTLCLCAALLLLAESTGPKLPISFRHFAPSLILLLPVVFFFDNQKGYRAYDLFEPVLEVIHEMNKEEQRDHYLVVGTTAPNVAENYFDAQGVAALAGDFNLQLPVKQFLYRSALYRDRDLLYVEMEPALNFPFRYILSQYGRAEEVMISKTPALRIHTREPRTLEPFTFRYDPDSNAFVSSKLHRLRDHSMELNEDYSRAFKATLGELGIDSLYALAARTDFQGEMNSEAAIVITVDMPNGESIWQHEFLNVFLVEPDGWNTAYKGVTMPPVTDPETRVSFYVWNPRMDRVKLRNLEITLNSRWVLPPE